MLQRYFFLLDLLSALSSLSSADCTSDIHLRAEAATFFISCASPRAIACRMGSPYGGTAPLSAFKDFLLDFFVPDFFPEALRVGMMVLP